jgi:hypothetical protein
MSTWIVGQKPNGKYQLNDLRFALKFWSQILNFNNRRQKEQANEGYEKEHGAGCLGSMVRGSSWRGGFPVDSRHRRAE